MKKRPSLFHQFKMSIDRVFKENLDKHALKIKYRKKKMNIIEEKAFKAHIWSHRYRINLLKFVKGFIKWLKEEAIYDEYKYVYELEPEIFAQYIYHLKEEGCSRETLRVYMSYIRKLENIFNFLYPKYEYDFSSCLPHIKELYTENYKLRNYCLSKESYLKFINYLIKRSDYKPMGSCLGSLLIAVYGLRIGEVINLQFRDFLYVDEIKEFNKLYVRSEKYIKVHKGKGGLRRYIPCLLPYQEDLFDYVKELQREYNIEPDCYILTLNKKEIDPVSIRKFTKNRMRELGIIPPNSAPTSCHMLRKTYKRIMTEFLSKHPELIINK